MLKKILILPLLAALALAARAQEWNTQVPIACKWTGDRELVFTYDGSYTDGFALDVKGFRRREGVSAPERYADFPVHPEGAVNLTFSPDSTRLAFTRRGDLWVVDIASGQEQRLTFDGSETLLNGYASWVYYEEIFGRPSKYRAFWWSPDSDKIAFYRFDNSRVPVFPIYSAAGQNGSLRNTRYPKAGQPNPTVRIGLISGLKSTPTTVWADFDEEEDGYYGTPFWGPDSQSLYVSREPRIQNTLDLYRVQVSDGSKTPIYHEHVDTWLNWIDGMLFTDKGLYMVRDFETGWQQIYFLGYDGSLKRLTDGDNWRISLLALDEKKGDVFFTAERDSHIRTVLYKVNKKGEIQALTDPAYSVRSVSFSPSRKHFTAWLSNYRTPYQIWVFETAAAPELARKGLGTPSRKACKVADWAGPDFQAERYALPQTLTLTTEDGLELPAAIVYPKDFDPSRRYPVHMDIYGGPDTPLVREAWQHPTERTQWWSQQGIIQITADCRAAGHNGRAGLDCIYRNLSVHEVGDFVAWARYLQSLPYVQGDKIGVEGFSFGGTMTALLVFDHPEQFHYGIAGGGVYDWALYDTHYTERFMETPATNPEGYARTRVLDHAANYVTDNTFTPGIAPVMLKLTHGTGDDNVHFQHTLQLIDRLQQEGKQFEFMIYPDGMHGYRGYQGTHFLEGNRAFWRHYLKGE